MLTNLAKNPPHLLNKWLCLPPIKQYAVLSALLLLGLVFLSYRTYSLYIAKQQQQNILQQLHQQAQHQNKILIQLKQQQEKYRQNSNAVQQLPLITQSLHQLAEKYTLHIDDEWQFGVSPILSMHINGNFIELHQWVSQLLQQHSSLHLLEMKINKDPRISRHIDAEIRLQLSKELL